MRGGAARTQAAALKLRLAEAARCAESAAAIEAARQSIAGIPGQPASFRRLHRLLDAQAYRLAYWRVAADEINYRRFFNVNDLAGLCIERPELFAETHRMILALVARGDVGALRIDHIDGLFDPVSYLDRLREQCGTQLYLVVEKILARYETLPDWPVDGSTGYDFANQVLGLFVDPDAERAMTRLYRRVTGRGQDFDAVLAATRKRRIMQVNLSSEMHVLARRFHRLSMSDWRTRDFTFNGLLAALQQVIRAFPVYRTYVSERGASADDRRYIDWAIATAKKQSLANDTSILDFVHQVLNGEVPGHSRPAEVLRTADAVSAGHRAGDGKGLRGHRLLPVFPPGGAQRGGVGYPRRFGLSPAAFHHSMRERARSLPRAMSATATHDTKRGEDARIRLAMLSEMPGRWSQYVSRWLRFNRSRRSETDGDMVPDRNAEYLFYQTLVGVWPPGLVPSDVGAVQALAERVVGYMIKAVREGKEQSSWSNHNAVYEAALTQFVETALDATRPNKFLADFSTFMAPWMRSSAIASLAQLALKLTAPGVPDIYQGCELWDFSLVDPDNRRAPDWPQRRALLPESNTTDPSHLAAAWEDGREKLFATQRLLRLRAEQTTLFEEGDYTALYAEGDSADHLCSFHRQHTNAAVVVAVPRLVYRLYAGGEAPPWGDTRLALPGPAGWRDVFTDRGYEGGASVPVAALFAGFPVAVLLRTGD